MQKKGHQYKWCISVILALSMLLSCMPQMVLANETTPPPVVTATNGFTGSDTKVEDPIIDSGSKDKDKVDTYHNEGNSNPAITGLHFKEVTSGTANLSEPGIYLAQDEAYTYVYTVAKKAGGGTKYRTIGFTISDTKYPNGDLKGKPNTLTLRIKYGDNSDAIGLEPHFKTNMNSQIVANAVQPVFEKRGKFDVTSAKGYYTDDTMSNLIGTCYRVQTSALSGLIRANQPDKWSLETLYLSGIQAVSKNGVWKNTWYINKNESIAGLKSVGIGSPSTEEIPDLYNIPIKIPKLEFSVNYINIKTGEVIKEEKLSPKIVDSLEITKEKMATNSVQIRKDKMLSIFNMGLKNNKGIITLDNKTYTLRGVGLMPGILDANNKDSLYLKQVKDNIVGKGLKFPQSCQMSTADMSIIAETGLQFYHTTSTVGDIGVNKLTLNGGQFDKGVMAFQSLDRAEDEFIIYNNPIFGCRGYIYVDPDADLTGYNGEMLYVNKETGRYFSIPGKPMDYASKESEAIETFSSSNNRAGSFIGMDKVKDIRDVEGTTNWNVPSKPDEDGYAYDTVNWTVKDGLGKYYILDGIEYLNEFVPAENGTPTQGWLDYAKETERQSTQSVMSGSSAYIGTKLPSIYPDAEEVSNRFKWSSSIDMTYGNNNGSVIKGTYEQYFTAKWCHPLNSNKESAIPMYRAIYKPIGDIDVVYYSKETGKPLRTEKTSPMDDIVVSSKVRLDSVVYNTEQISYRVDTTLQEDIDTTSPPVMNSSDLNVTSGFELKIPQDVVDKGNFIVRVSCTTGAVPLKPLDDLGNFKIPKNYLSKPFNLSIPLSEHVDKTPDVERSHTYKKGSGKKRTTHTCTYTDPKHNWGTNKFSWDSVLERILSPLNYIFADRYGLTSVNKMDYSSGSEDITGALNLKWTSHRTDVDGVAPVFAKYMAPQNTASLAYLNNHSMKELANVGLVPNVKYNNKGGVEEFHINVMEGWEQGINGWEYKKGPQGHGGCGRANYMIEQSPKHPKGADFSHAVHGGTVTAEPSYTAKPLAVAGAFGKVEGEFKNSNFTYFNTNTNKGIKFYPTYAMKTGDESTAWVLGKEQRTLNAIQVAEMKILNTKPVVDVQTTWSRDKVDNGKLSMKSGYVLNSKTNEPMKLQLTTYTVVPKDGWVENSAAIRKELLDDHDEMVNQLKINTNYNIMTNVPESFNTNVRDIWKKTNPYRKSGDNILKSRVPAPVGLSVTSVKEGNKILTLNNIDSKYYHMGVDNEKRVKAQLEQNGWYSEKFDGFEIIQQTTVISATYKDTKFVNFIRNGGENYNDLAQPAGNIEGKNIGLEFGIYKKAVNFMGNNIEVERPTIPKLFFIRGTAYDDRV